MTKQLSPATRSVTNQAKKKMGMLDDFITRASPLLNLPVKLAFAFPYTPQAALLMFVAAYRRYYRADRHDVFISWMFQSDKYGMPSMYTIFAVFAEVQHIIHIVSGDLAGQKDTVQLNRKQLTTLGHRWTYAVIRCLLVFTIFSLNTDEKIVSHQKLHGFGVNALMAVGTLQFFGVQWERFRSGYVKAASVAVTVFLLGTTIVLSEKLGYMPQGTAPEPWAAINCYVELLSLAWTIPRFSGWYP